MSATLVWIASCRRCKQVTKDTCLREFDYQICFSWNVTVFRRLLYRFKKKKKKGNVQEVLWCTFVQQSSRRRHAVARGIWTCVSRIAPTCSSYWCFNCWSCALWNSMRPFQATGLYTWLVKVTTITHVFQRQNEVCNCWVNLTWNHEAYKNNYWTVLVQWQRFTYYINILWILGSTLIYL